MLTMKRHTHIPQLLTKIFIKCENSFSAYLIQTQIKIFHLFQEDLNTLLKFISTQQDFVLESTEIHQILLSFREFFLQQHQHLLWECINIFLNNLKQISLEWIINKIPISIRPLQQLLSIQQNLGSLCQEFKLKDRQVHLISKVFLSANEVRFNLLCEFDGLVTILESLPIPSDLLPLISSAISSIIVLIIRIDLIFTKYSISITLSLVFIAWVDVLMCRHMSHAKPAKLIFTAWMLAQYIIAPLIFLNRVLTFRT